MEVWPGGWPGEIEAALIDAVLSIHARYGQPSTGVRGAVARYRQACGEEPLDDLARLATYPPPNLADLLENRQETGDVPKPRVIIAAATNLVSAGVTGQWVS